MCHFVPSISSLSTRFNVGSEWMSEWVSAEDSVVKCIICGELRSKSNISRHYSMCRTRGAGEDGQSRASSVARSRSTSTDSGMYSQVSRDQWPTCYSPQGICTMLSSVILEAVNALLDQHLSYSQEKVTSAVRFKVLLTYSCSSDKVVWVCLHLPKFSWKTEPPSSGHNRHVYSINNRSVGKFPACV